MGIFDVKRGMKPVDQIGFMPEALPSINQVHNFTQTRRTLKTLGS